MLAQQRLNFVIAVPCPKVFVLTFLFPPQLNGRLPYFNLLQDLQRERQRARSKPAKWIQNIKTMFNIHEPRQHERQIFDTDPIWSFVVQKHVVSAVEMVVFWRR